MQPPARAGAGRKPGEMQSGGNKGDWNMVARRSRTLEACVVFARWVQEQRVNYLDLAELLQLARAAFKAGERECNTGRSADKQREAFEAKAGEMGFGVQWPGLWPTLKRDGRDIYLPEV